MQNFELGLDILQVILEINKIVNILYIYIKKKLLHAGPRSSFFFKKKLLKDFFYKAISI